MLTLLVSMAVLAYAAYADWTRRMVPNWVWVVYLAVGIPLMLVEGIDTYWLWRSVLVVSAASLITYAVGQMGGADVKGMLAMSVVLHSSGVAVFAVALGAALGLVLVLIRSVLLRSRDVGQMDIPFMVPLLVGTLVATAGLVAVRTI